MIPPPGSRETDGYFTRHTHARAKPHFQKSETALSEKRNAPTRSPAMPCPVHATRQEVGKCRASFSGQVKAGSPQPAMTMPGTGERGGTWKSARTHAHAQAHGSRLSILPAYHPERERAAQGNLDRRLTAVELPCWYAGKERNKECHFDKAPPKTNDLPKANGQ